MNLLRAVCSCRCSYSDNAMQVRNRSASLYSEEQGLFQGIWRAAGVKWWCTALIVHGVTSV